MLGDAWAISIALIVLGSIGSLFGGLIKAAVSRQREYLADASAVQFTRNPRRHRRRAEANWRSPTFSVQPTCKHPRAAEVSHMYFATKASGRDFTSLMATHPPLSKRIKAIEPGWDGKLPEALAPGRR